MDPVHVQHRKLQDAEADVDRLLYECLDFPHLDNNPLLFEDFQAHTVWLFAELLALPLTVDVLEVGPLLLSLACFPVYRVVHQLDNSI